MLNSGRHSRRWLVVLLMLAAAGAAAQIEAREQHRPRLHIGVSGTVTPTIHPLVVLYTVRSSAAGKAYVEFDDGAGISLRTSAQEIENPGGTVGILVAGMRPSTPYTLRAVVQTTEGRIYFDRKHAITTGAVTAPLPAFSVTRSGVPSAGVELLDMVVPNGLAEAAAIDLDGTVIWYYAFDPKLGAASALRLMPNGHLLLILGTKILREIDLAGATVHEMSVDDLNQKLAAAGRPTRVTAFHHDALPLANGHSLLLCEERRTFNNLAGTTAPSIVRGDVIVELDEAFTPSWTWSAFDHLDVNRHPMDVVDWTHANALFYSPTDGALLVSMRNQHWVLKIDYANGRGSGDVLWRLGYQGDMTLDTGNDFDWFYGQHFPVIVDADQAGPLRIALFDNRATNEDGTTCAAVNGTCASRGAIFAVDEGARLASVQWQDWLSLYSLWGGSIQTLPDHHIEIDVPNPFSNVASRVLEIDRTTLKTVWQLDVGGQFVYRSFRLPSLYPGVQW